MIQEATRRLEPALLWQEFDRISRIPRASGNEAGVRAYVLDKARAGGLEARTDTTGNVCVSVPASPGREGAPAVVLQGHLDMVCEKRRDHEHDFTRDPIRWVREGDRVRAVGTSLGADNGIGVAAALALMDASAPAAHGPLRMLFTVDEETGLTGARGLDPGLCLGKILLNLDSEQEGTLYIGCAGGMYTDLSLDLATEPPPPGAVFLRVRVGGGVGGHSGLNIHEGRANAVRLTAQVLSASAAGTGLRLASLEGGDKHNAIPRECDAVCCVPPDRAAVLQEAVANAGQRFLEACRGIDDGLFARAEQVASPGAARVLAAREQERLLDLLLRLPHGVVAMHPSMADTVESSTNLAAVRCAGGRAEIRTKQRSSAERGLEEVAEGVARLARAAGARVRQGGRYPSWRPDPDAAVLKTARRVYRERFGRDPHVRVIHAGLECGIIGDKVPGMEMLSFGPTIRSAHSPEEHVEVGSVSAFWDFLVAVLEALSAG